MTSNLFDSQTIGSNPRWWTGIIVSDESWKGNKVPEKWSEVDTLPGWGARYKVRIVGDHTENKNKLPDDKLELCEVLYPVTGGSGHAASYQTSNLRKGSVVFGIYKDNDGNEPLILGCVGNNEQTYLKEIQEKGFDPFSGFNFDLPVPYYSIVPEGSPPITGPNGATKIETCSDSTETRNNICDQEQTKENSEYVSSSTTCDASQLGAIQIKIRNLIQDIERVKRQTESWKQALTKGIQDVEAFIKNAVDDAAKFIAGVIKWVITEIQKKVTEKVNNAAKDLYFNIFPNERPGLKQKMETVNDLIACLFRKIIRNLLKMVTNFLLDAVEKLINVPICVVENLVGSLLGKITGLIISGIDAILAPIKALLGLVDLAGDILGFLIDVLSFISCDEKGKCPEIKEWHIWDGPSDLYKFDFNSLIDSAKTFASDFTESINPDNFDFDLDFSDAFIDSCYVGPIACGPPTVQIFGREGSGAAGNVIVSAAGEILGVDITTPGSGYVAPPFVNFVDACGNGQSAAGTAIIENSQVVAIVMDDPGTGYLSAPNGALGGDNRTWAKPNQTTVQRNDGSYDTPYNPGDIIELQPGDKICIPNNSTTQIANQIVNGGCTTVDDITTVQAPEPQPVDPQSGDYPVLNSGEYRVILSIEDIIIQDGGFGYSDGDQIVIEPSNGATAVPNFGAFGALESVTVTSPGEGFTEFPRIYINSRTGNNAVLTPKFKIESISINQMRDPGIQDKIISVVDCVGKVPDVNFFRVPR
jgi:hypothetical protein